MTEGTDTAPPLRLAGRYERVVAASLERVWENVFDWEHLPSLHAGSFHAVRLLDHGPWGWKVSLWSSPADPPQGVELRADRTAGSYCVTTLDGPGAGSEVRTRLERRSATGTAVGVEFHVPEHRTERLAVIGGRYAQLYQRLWDEDEAMMVARERALAQRARRRAVRPRPKRLGPLTALQPKLPLTVTFGGERFRIVELDGDLVAHAVTCPHWLGPLDAAPVDDGCVRCPWHGYAFDVRTGASADGRVLSLPTAPRVLVRDGEVILSR